MPVGILTNAAAVFTGGILGTVFGKYLPQRLITALQNIFGICAIAIGVTLIIKVQALTPVVLSIILGIVLGEAVDLDRWFGRLAKWLQGRFPARGPGLENENIPAQFISLLMLVCTASTGILGAMTEGLTGDPEILFAKAVLDFFTVAIFAVSLGWLSTVISVPFLIVDLAVFAMADGLSLFATQEVIGDFMACGGIITFSTGLRVCKIKEIKVANLLPALLIIIPVAFLWHQYM